MSLLLNDLTLVRAEEQWGLLPELLSASKGVINGIRSTGHSLGQLLGY